MFLICSQEDSVASLSHRNRHALLGSVLVPGTKRIRTLHLDLFKLIHDVGTGANRHNLAMSKLCLEI